MASVVVVVAAVVVLPAVTWATGPGSQCVVTPAGTDPAARPGRCEPAPETGVGDEVMARAVVSRAPTGAEGQTPADEGPAAGPELTDGESAPEPSPEPEPSPAPEPEQEPDDGSPTVSGLSLSATAEPAVVGPGDTVTLVVTVVNAGPASDAEVTVVGAIPPGALVLRDVEGLDPSSGSISLGALAIGTSREVTIVVEMPLSPGELVASPQVAGQHSEALNVEHQDTVVVAVVPDTELPADGDVAAPRQSSSTPEPKTDSIAGSAAEPLAEGDEPGGLSGDEPAWVSGLEPGAGRVSPGAGLQSGMGHPRRSAEDLRRFPAVAASEHAGQTTTGPLELRSGRTTDSAPAGTTGAVGDRFLAAPLTVLGMGLLAVGGALLGLSGAGSVRSRRR